MTIRVEPIRKQITIECGQEHAFKVFTAGMGGWWPRAHHIGKVEMKSAVVEPAVGGRVYEVGIDGSECEWGKVLVWDPPRNFTWSWQLTAQWQYDPDFVTTVEVKFVAEGPKRTLVQLEHRDLERYGEAASTIREQLEPGWILTLDDYAKDHPELAASIAKFGDGKAA